MTREPSCLAPLRYSGNYIGFCLPIIHTACIRFRFDSENINYEFLSILLDRLLVLFEILYVHVAGRPGGSVGNLLLTLGREFESRRSHTNWDFSSQKKYKKILYIHICIHIYIYIYHAQ